MGTTSPDLLLTLDRERSRGLRAQIEEGIRSAIRGGRLRTGARLPSTRALAADLGVTRRVVVEAYDQLVAEGYVISRQGAGTLVNAVAHRDRAPGPVPSTAQAVRVDFRPGHPDPALFPRREWGRAGRAALLGAAELSDMDRRGLPRLRVELAEYLARVRGVDADPDRIVVCAGFGHAFDLLVEVLRGRTFAVEDPGYPPPRVRLARAGIPVEPVPVDRDGLVVDRLRAGPARVAVVTPAHQSPTGVPMSPRRRHELVDWARAVDGYVVEDDFDAEFRYDRRPVGALQGLAPDRVVYCGTTAKTLACGLRLGWMVLPETLVDDVCRLRAETDGGASGVLASTFAELLRSGDLDRHLRRSRRVYRERRDAVVDAVVRRAAGGDRQRDRRRPHRRSGPARGDRRAGGRRRGGGARCAGLPPGPVPRAPRPPRPVCSATAQCHRRRPRRGCGSSPTPSPAGRAGGTGGRGSTRDRCPIRSRRRCAHRPSRRAHDHRRETGSGGASWSPTWRARSRSTACWAWTSRQAPTRSRTSTSVSRVGCGWRSTPRRRSRASIPRGSRVRVAG